MSEVMMQHTNSVLSPSQKQFLRDLPLTSTREIEGVRVSLRHEAPPIGFCPPIRTGGWRNCNWRTRTSCWSATHLPFVRQFGA